MSHGVIDPARLGQTALPDGRRLGWAEWGPERGRPLLFCPGAATSRWLGFGGDLVAHLGLRLISVDRPGLGASDPRPGRTLRDWADDLRHLLRDRALEAPLCLGYSQGAPFALAGAAADLFDAVAVVAGTDELGHPDLVGRLDPGLRALVDAAVADPANADALFSNIKSADTLWGMIVTMIGDADRAIYDEPAFARAYQRALSEGFAQGPAGYARDTALAMARWPFDMAAIAAPVELWYGEHDTSPVHSPDLGATLARRIPRARRHVIAGAGGALLWTHSEAILRSLIDAGQRGEGA